MFKCYEECSTKNALCNTFFVYCIDFYFKFIIISRHVLKIFVIMSYYGRESHSKTPEERMKEMVRLWNYDVEWLRFIPKEETTPLSLEELKDMRDNLPENRQFGFAMMAGGAVSCENKHGGLLLMRHGYLPVFWSCRSVY